MIELKEDAQRDEQERMLKKIQHHREPPGSGIIHDEWTSIHILGYLIRTTAHIDEPMPTYVPRQTIFPEAVLQEEASPLPYPPFRSERTQREHRRDSQRRQ